MAALEIETARLRLRKFTPDDLNDLSAIRADPDVMRYIGSGKPESIEQVRTTLNKLLAHWGQHGFGRWAVVYKEVDRLIGWCGLSYLESTGEVEIGYGVAKSYWGKGLTLEAAPASIKCGFDELNLDRIVAVAWPDIIISRRVMDRLGMRYVKAATIMMLKWFTTPFRVTNIGWLSKERNGWAPPDHSESRWQGSRTELGQLHYFGEIMPQADSLQVVENISESVGLICISRSPVLTPPDPKQCMRRLLATAASSMRVRNEHRFALVSSYQVGARLRRTE